MSKISNPHLYLAVNLNHKNTAARLSNKGERRNKVNKQWYRKSAWFYKARFTKYGKSLIIPRENIPEDVLILEKWCPTGWQKNAI